MKLGIWILAVPAAGLIQAETAAYAGGGMNSAAVEILRNRVVPSLGSSATGRFDSNGQECTVLVEGTDLDNFVRFSLLKGQPGSLRHEFVRSFEFYGDLELYDNDLKVTAIHRSEARIELDFTLLAGRKPSVPGRAVFELGADGRVSRLEFSKFVRVGDQLTDTVACSGLQERAR